MNVDLIFSKIPHALMKFLKEKVCRRTFWAAVAKVDLEPPALIRSLWTHVDGYNQINAVIIWITSHAPRALAQPILDV